MSEWKKISDIADVRRGASPRPIGDPKFFGGEVGWVRISDVTRSTRFLRHTEQYVSPLGESLSVRVDPGDLIMSICGTLGRPIIIDIPACIHDGFVRFSNLRDTDTPYLYYVLQNAESAFNGMGQPGTQTNLNTGLVGGYRILIPSLPQQRRIAEILGTVDEAIEGTESLIAKQQMIKAGMMHDLFTRGMSAAGRLRSPHNETPHLYKKSRVGWIPKEWDDPLLDDVAHRASGHTPNRDHPEYWDGGIKWVSLADSWRLDRVYISETDKEISALGIANSSAVLHPPGIVVLSRDAGIGKSAITTCEMAVSQHFMCWRCGPKLDTHYFYYWLQHRKREFENIATGTTIPTIGLRFFKNYRLPVSTDVNEQKKIGAMLLSADQTIQAEAAHLAKLRQLKQGLMQDLLTSRVPVPA